MTRSIVPGMVFVSEREPGRWIDCAPCSGVMAAHYARPSIPATLESAHLVRRRASLPHSGGMTQAQVDLGLQKAFNINPSTVTKANIPARLRAGYAVITPLTMGLVPAVLRRWQPSFTGSHSVCLVGVNSLGRFGWYDPLAPEGHSGEWVTWADIDQAIWSTALVLKGASR